MLFPDLRPTPQLVWMEKSIREIQGGIGKLLLHARREHDGIAVHYSQASVHANTLLGRHLNSAQTGACRLLEDLGFQYEVLSYEQIERGGLKDFRVLVLPSSFALTEGEVRAIRQFIARGGTLLADRVPGVLDGHCRPLERGSLDDLFGVSRSELPKRPTGTETPTPTVHRAGPGRAAVLNTEFGPYEGQRKSGTGGPLRDALRKILAEAGRRPAIELAADGRPLEGCEVVRFADGGIQYVCITSDQDYAGAKPQQVTIRLPGSAQVFDVRSQRDLGRGEQFSVQLVPGDPRVYALLPYAVRGVSVSGPDKPVAAGATATFQLGIDLGTAKPAGRHCLHVELVGPDGNVRPHYSRNVLLDKLKGAVTIDLALNDPAGNWQIRLTDVASGRSATAAFRVVGGGKAS